MCACYLSIEMSLLELRVISMGWEQTWLGQRCSLEGTQVWEHPLGLLSPDALSEGCKDTEAVGALLLCPARLVAPEPAIRAAWQQGGGLPGPRVVRSQRPSPPKSCGKAAGFAANSVGLLHCCSSELCTQLCCGPQ